MPAPLAEHHERVADADLGVLDGAVVAAVDAVLDAAEGLLQEAQLGLAVGDDRDMG